MFLDNFFQLLITGLLIGCIYGLMSAGLSLIFGIMRVINFAQGDLMMLGMYAAWYFFTVLGMDALFGAYSGAIIAALFVGPLLFCIGYLLHWLLISQVSGTKIKGSDEGHYAQFILTLGIALILENGTQIIFGSEPISLNTPLSFTAWSFFATDKLSLFVNEGQAIAASLSVLCVIALYIFVSKTRLGRALRASADNSDAAIYMGIDVNKAYRIAFGIGTGATAVAGGLIAISLPIQPFVGADYIIIMFAGVVIGGLGSITGAFWGGLSIGMVQQLSTLVLPQQLQNAAVFGVFLIVIFFRPQGFFGRSVERA